MHAKKSAAEKAATFVEEGMLVGLGTGSTSVFAIQAIGRMVRGGMSLTAVASSLQSEALARAEGIPLVSFTHLQPIDLYIDGADEVAEDFTLVKGGGGALLREKILAYNSRLFVVIVDASKLVPQLGKFPLPVEVIPFAHELTQQHLRNLGCSTRLRLHEGAPFLTDNGNLVVDCSFHAIVEPESIGAAIKSIPGVVEHGLFAPDLVGTVIVGEADGSCRVLGKNG